ncbi:MAG TPA: hypothetical protein VKU88_04410, partial [Acidimicrobiales bacterium]|nr:hypothetical protein [Acidimicrobiales bacterium]
LWDWKANCSPGVGQAACDAGTWAVYYPDASAQPAENHGLVPSRVQYVSRAYPRFVAGTLLSFGYDPADGSFAMSATDNEQVHPSNTGALTVVYAPAGVTGAPSVSGAAKLVRVVDQPDGSRLVEVAPTGAGAYQVSLAPTRR